MVFGNLLCGPAGPAMMTVLPDIFPFALIIAVYLEYALKKYVSISNALFDVI